MMNILRSFKNISLLKLCVVTLFTIFSASVYAQESAGLRGENSAVQAAQKMVESMGGEELWTQLQSLYFVHEWYPIHRGDKYLEEEILDLTGPRSWVKMESEIYYNERVYSPEYGYWRNVNGEINEGSTESFNSAMNRSPFNIYRLARGIALKDSFYEIRIKDPASPVITLLFYDDKGDKGGEIVLNANFEPRVWRTNDYTYTFGPMQEYGNIRVPRWGVYENGSFIYEMVSLKGSSKKPSPDQFKLN